MAIVNNKQGRQLANKHIDEIEKVLKNAGLFRPVKRNEAISFLKGYVNVIEEEIRYLKNLYI